MAVIWNQKCGSNHYEIHSAGYTLRLYRNGIRHSQWNPNRPLSGSGYWDLVAIPALHRPKGSIDSLLMLGFGAGTVATTLHELLDIRNIVGVELDAIHLSLAKKFFEIPKECDLIVADAVEWVQKEADNPNAAKHDMIIVDLYSEEDGKAICVMPTNLEWYGQLEKLLKPSGIIVINLASIEEIAYLKPLATDFSFFYSECFYNEKYGNCVVAFSENPFDKVILKDNLSEIYSRYPRCRNISKSYSSINPLIVMAFPPSETYPKVVDWVGIRKKGSNI